MIILYLFLSTPRFSMHLFFFFQAEDGIRDGRVTGVQTCALPISCPSVPSAGRAPAGSWTAEPGSRFRRGAHDRPFRHSTGGLPLSARAHPSELWSLRPAATGPPAGAPDGSHDHRPPAQHLPRLPAADP